jgi:hypothetical protein
MSKLDPKSFKFALYGAYMNDPEVTYLEDEDGWKQWDLAEVLFDQSFNFTREVYEARPR